MTTAVPPDPIADLVARLGALPREKRSGQAITDADIAHAAGLDVAALADLCGQLSAIGVVLGPFRQRVKVAQSARAPSKRAHLRVVADDEIAEDDRPAIHYDASRAHEAVAVGIQALADRAENLYQRDGVLVHVVGAEDLDEADPAPQARGTPTIRTMAASTLWECASESARWMKWDGRAEKHVGCAPPSPVVAAIMTRGTYPRVRELSGILESPSIRPDGSLLIEPGYDAATGYLLCPSARYEAPVEQPTQGDAMRALLELLEVFCDFPYCDDAARVVPISAVLTMIARPAIRGAIPGVFFDASMRGAGKSLQADAVVMLATGRIPPPMSFPESNEELEKVLGAYALRGPSFVKFDNVDRPFGGGPLDRVLTAPDRAPLRVLGQSTIAEVPWRALVMGTGTNLCFAGDTARRMLVARIEPTDENPEHRENFRHPDLLAWIEAERVRLVRAALTILRAFVVAGRPRGECKSWGSFDAWARLIPPAIVYAGGADPMTARPSERGEEDPAKVANSIVIAHLPRLDIGGQGMSARAIVDALYPQNGKREGPPDGFDDLREAIESIVPTRAGNAPSSRILGDRFRAMRRRPIGGKRLDVAPTKAHGNVARWIVTDA